MFPALAHPSPEPFFSPQSLPLALAAPAAARNGLVPAQRPAAAQEPPAAKAPLLARAAAARFAAGRRTGLPTELGAWFDGSRVSDAGGPAVPRGKVGKIRSLLRQLSEPYRTQRQLARLEESPRAPGESFEFAVIGDAEPGRLDRKSVV